MEIGVFIAQALGLGMVLRFAAQGVGACWAFMVAMARSV